MAAAEVMHSACILADERANQSSSKAGSPLHADSSGTNKPCRERLAQRASGENKLRGASPANRLVVGEKRETVLD